MIMDVPCSLHPYGEAALILEAGEEIREDAFLRVRGLAEELSRNPPPGMIETVPAYTSLLVTFDPLAADYAEVEASVRARMEASSAAPRPRSPVVSIPVCYEEPYALDLHEVARHAGLQPSEVVSIHSSGTYLVYMLGFTPGFPYLGGMDERIATPRRASPRTRIPAGSVGIADRQTGVYPQESPGGWNIIGRTPAVLFDPARQPPALLAAGLSIRFYPISASRFGELVESAEAGLWKPEVEEPSP